jgi:hypothetical protein
LLLDGHSTAPLSGVSFASQRVVVARLQSPSA